MKNLSLLLLLRVAADPDRAAADRNPQRRSLARRKKRPRRRKRKLPRKQRRSQPRKKLPKRSPRRKPLRRKVRRKKVRGAGRKLSGFDYGTLLMQRPFCFYEPKSSPGSCSAG